MKNIKLLILIVLPALSFFGCSKPENRESVINSYKKLVKAERSGNGKLWLKLHSEQQLGELSAAEKEQIEKGFPSRPEVNTEILSVLIRENEAAVFVKETGESGGIEYKAMKLILENGCWKFTGEISVSEDEPVNPYAFLPPEKGLFAENGGRWREVTGAVLNDSVHGYETSVSGVKAALDGSFLYIRLESRDELQKPGIELFNIKELASLYIPDIEVSAVLEGEGESADRIFTVKIDNGITTKTTFAEDGRANGNKDFLNYDFTFYKLDSSEGFRNSTGFSTELMKVGDRIIDLMIPRGCFGFDTLAELKITLNGSLFCEPYAVKKFN
ncbi:MAG: hypothetical protein ABIJ15_04860 [bacterium]